MPTYEYKCLSCGNIQEEIHSISSNPQISCSKCGSNSEKIFSPSGNFILKGGDWTSYNSRIKNDMKRKNTTMKGIMKERESSGEGMGRI